MAWRQAAEFVHRYARSLRRIDAIETPHCWAIWKSGCLSSTTWHLADRLRRSPTPGKRNVVLYVGIFQGGSLMNKTVDVPLIESRLMHWLNYRFGLKGYLHWGSTPGLTIPFARRASIAGMAGMFTQTEWLLNLDSAGNKCATACRTMSAYGSWKTGSPPSKLLCPARRSFH